MEGLAGLAAFAKTSGERGEGGTALGVEVRLPDLDEEGGGDVEVAAVERGADRLEGRARGGGARHGERGTRRPLEGERSRQAAERPGVAFDESKRCGRVAPAKGSLDRGERESVLRGGPGLLGRGAGEDLVDERDLGSFRSGPHPGAERVRQLGERSERFERGAGGEGSDDPSHGLFSGLVVGGAPGAVEELRSFGQRGVGREREPEEPGGFREVAAVECGGAVLRERGGALAAAGVLDLAQDAPARGAVGPAGEERAGRRFGRLEVAGGVKGEERLLGGLPLVPSRALEAGLELRRLRKRGVGQAGGGEVGRRPAEVARVERGTGKGCVDTGRERAVEAAREATGAIAVARPGRGEGEEAADGRVGVGRRAERALEPEGGRVVDEDVDEELEEGAGGGRSRAALDGGREEALGLLVVVLLERGEAAGFEGRGVVGVAGPCSDAPSGGRAAPARGWAGRLGAGGFRAAFARVEPPPHEGARLHGELRDEGVAGVAEARAMAQAHDVGARGVGDDLDLLAEAGQEEPLEARLQRVALPLARALLARRVDVVDEGEELLDADADPPREDVLGVGEAGGAFLRHAGGEASHAASRRSSPGR